VSHAPSQPRRLQALIHKEFLQILRDPSSIAIAFLLPVLLLLIFGYCVSLNARDVPLAVVLDKHDTSAGSFIAELEHSPWFRPVYMSNMKEASSALLAGRVNGIVRLRANFVRRIKGGGTAPVQILVNGVDANNGRLVLGYLLGAWFQWIGHQAQIDRLALRPPVVLEQRVWYNAPLESRWFLVPGLIAVIMTLIGALLTAMVVAREWERGTMEALMATPVTLAEILLGKLIPYFLLGIGGLVLSVAMAVWQFEVPMRGSWGVLLLGSALFLLVALGMGLLISILARNQFVAGQVAIIVTFLPAFILSGFIFDIGSMPAAVQWITHIIPARYYVAILQTVFLAGDVSAVITPNALVLGLMALLFIALARARMHKRIE